MTKVVSSLLVCLTVFVAGCDMVEFKHRDKDKEVEVDKGKDKKKVKTEVKEIADSMSDVSEADCKLVYMQFSGLAAYLEHSTKIQTVKELNSLFSRFQDDYGYGRGKYKDYKKAVNEFFIDRGYDKAKTIVDGEPRSKTELSREDVISDMKILAEAAKMAMEK